jgi:predicted phage terminase large subunit-like protein
VALSKDGIVYIRDLIYGHWEWPDAKKQIIDCMRAEPLTKHGVELKMHGLAAVQELRRDRRVAHVPLRGCQVDGDKVARADGWTDRAREGKVHLVKGEWIGEFLKEVCEFPFGHQDDIVDTVSGGLKMMSKVGGRIIAW